MWEFKFYSSCSIKESIGLAIPSYSISSAFTLPTITAERAKIGIWFLSSVTYNSMGYFSANTSPVAIPGKNFRHLNVPRSISTIPLPSNTMAELYTESSRKKMDRKHVSYLKCIGIKCSGKIYSRYEILGKRGN